MTPLRALARGLAAHLRRAGLIARLRRRCRYGRDFLIPIWTDQERLEEILLYGRRHFYCKEWPALSLVCGPEELIALLASRPRRFPYHDPDLLVHLTDFLCAYFVRCGPHYTPIN